MTASRSGSDQSVVAWVALTIDCPDTTVQEKLRSFYAQALGGEVVEDCVRARGWLLIFDVVADYRPPTWPAAETPKQIHFEWMVEDLQHAVAALTAFGATPGGAPRSERCCVAGHARPGRSPLLPHDDEHRHSRLPG